MNILIFNWSDVKNPNSGGAEVLTHEMAKRWVRVGHAVTQYASKFSGSPHEEIHEGVKIVRGGSPIIRNPHVPVQIAAYRWYKRQKRNTFDIVIDEIHGIPFFTPLYVRVKKIALICEVANELWDVTFPFPLNAAGRLIERWYFPLYRQVPFVTISPSTKLDLVAKGVRPDNITVLPMGLTLPAKIPRYRKEKIPTLVFVGRLSKTKGVESLASVLESLSQDYPHIQLWIVGGGEDAYSKKLQKKFHLHTSLGRVKFFGFVSQEKKFALMARAHILLVPSVKEGWGLIVPEAGSVGTPAVAYDVPGLRDIARHRSSALLVAPNPQSMAAGVLSMLSDRFLYNRLQRGARELSRKYTWDQTAETALQVLHQTIR